MLLQRGQDVLQGRFLQVNNRIRLVGLNRFIGVSLGETPFTGEISYLPRFPVYNEGVADSIIRSFRYCFMIDSKLNCPLYYIENG